MSKIAQKGVSFIGGGNYASRVLIPAFKTAGANLETIVTSGGVNAFHHGVKNGFKQASTLVEDAFANKTDAVVVATQHNLHSEQVIMALEKGKNVYVEKPLAINSAGINDVIAAYDDAQKSKFAPQLVVGLIEDFRH